MEQLGWKPGGPAHNGRVEDATGALPGISGSRGLPSPITVSVTCPTFNRHHRHEALYRSFEKQTYEHKDLWIIDDSGSESPFFQRLGQSDPRVHYIALPRDWRVSTGCKRNWLIEKSAGSVIAHFDDDDCYAPRYIASMVNRLVQEDADLVKLSAWHERRENGGRCWTERPGNHGDVWGWGFSYVYRRSVASRVHFPDIRSGEDYPFVLALQRVGMKAVLIGDGASWVEHVLHGSNASKRA